MKNLKWKLLKVIRLNLFEFYFDFSFLCHKQLYFFIFTIFATVNHFSVKHRENPHLQQMSLRCRVVSIPHSEKMLST